MILVAAKMCAIEAKRNHGHLVISSILQSNHQHLVKSSKFTEDDDVDKNGLRRRPLA